MAISIQTRRSPTPVRRWQRGVHIAAGAVLLIFIYGGAVFGPVLTLLVQLVAFPALVISGVILWQWPRLRHMLRRIGDRS
jgi:hypothetical protein